MILHRFGLKYLALISSEDFYTQHSAVMDVGNRLWLIGGLGYKSDNQYIEVPIPARLNSKIRLVLPLVAKTNNLEEGGAGKQV